MRRVRVNIKQLKEPIELYPPTEVGRIVGVETKLGTCDPSRRPWITINNAINNENLYIINHRYGTFRLAELLAARPQNLNQLDLFHWLLRLHELFYHDYVDTEQPLTLLPDLDRLIRPTLIHPNVQTIRNTCRTIKLRQLNHLDPRWPNTNQACMSLAMAIALAFFQNRGVAAFAAADAPQQHSTRANILPDATTHFRILQMAGWFLDQTPTPMTPSRSTTSTGATA